MALLSMQYEDRIKTLESRLDAQISLFTRIPQTPSCDDHRLSITPFTPLERSPAKSAISEHEGAGTLKTRVGRQLSHVQCPSNITGNNVDHNDTETGLITSPPPPPPRDRHDSIKRLSGRIPRRNDSLSLKLTRSDLDEGYCCSSWWGRRKHQITVDTEPLPSTLGVHDTDTDTPSASLQR